MGSVHSLHDHAISRLRARLGAAEEDNRDLVAFARGHHGAAAAIHRAVLLAMAAEDAETLARTVTDDWPRVLGIDYCALALPGEAGITLATAASVSCLDPAILCRVVAGLPPVTLRNVERGHPLFGPACEAVRAEALVRVDVHRGKGGLLLLGQGRSPGLQECGASELLRVLGQSLGAMLARWRTQATD